MYGNLHGVPLYLDLTETEKYNDVCVLIADDIRNTNNEQKTFSIHCGMFRNPCRYIDYTRPLPRDEGIFHSVDIECLCNDDGTISVTGCDISLTRRYSGDGVNVYLPNQRCDTIAELVELVHHLHEYTADYKDFYVANYIDYRELTYEEPGFCPRDFGTTSDEIDNLIVEIDATFKSKFYNLDAVPLLK